MRILGKFCYSNIEPTEYDTSSCKEHKKLLELICRNEEKKTNNRTTEDPFEALLPERKRPIGGYGRLHKEYLKINYPLFFEELIRSNILWDYLAEINDQAEKKMKLLSDECLTPKSRKQAEEDVLAELIYCFNTDG